MVHHHLVPLHLPNMCWYFLLHLSQHTLLSLFLLLHLYLGRKFLGLSLLLPLLHYSLLDLEAEIVSSLLWEGLAREEIRVNPKQLYGMELDPIAHRLASIVVWIGYLQWKYEHRMPLAVDPPILHDLNKANIKRMDAILTYDALRQTGFPGLKHEGEMLEKE